MAFANILKEGTYSRIDNVSFNKKNKEYFFSFIIYENDLKKKVILQQNYSYSCSNNICKKVEKVYTSLEQFESSLEEIYYNNPLDKEYFPGVYEVKVEQFEEIIGVSGNTETKTKTTLLKKGKYNSVLFKDKFYKFLENSVEEFNGINTEYFFDNEILPKMNSNVIETMYKVLLLDEPSYGNYPQI